MIFNETIKVIKNLVFSNLMIFETTISNMS